MRCPPSRRSSKMAVVTVKCPVCAGDGVVPDPRTDGLLDMTCPACHGEGWLDVEVALDEGILVEARDEITD